MTTDATPSMIYVVDTSALFDLVRDRYPETTFAKTIWAKMNALIREGRLLTPREVYNELSAREGDMVFKWLKAQPQIVRDIDEPQTEAITRILGKCPELVNSKKLKPYHADSWVVALALVEHEAKLLFARTVAVLTQENDKQSPKKIPYCCKLLGVCCLSLLAMFEREGWDF